MNKLTMKYRVVHVGTRLLDDQIEFEAGTETFPPANATAKEFTSKEEAERYITQNELVYAIEE